MKFNAWLFALATLACLVSAEDTDKKEEMVASAYGVPAAPAYAPPPCPKNYLFSCQPNVAPVPCAPSHGGYAGAYSEQVLQYAKPQYALPHYHI